MTLTIGFVGASHLSYVSAIAAAEKSQGGFKVVCYATEHLFEKDKPETLSIQEPDLLRLMDKNKSHLLFTSDLKDLRRCDLVYLAIDVPTDDKGTSDLNIIRKQIENITPHLLDSAFLVILSQVPPGFTRSVPFPQERLFYQVETLIFGKAVERALFPERFIIGNFEKAGKLPQIYADYLKKFNCPIFLMNYESAELAKISINLYLVSTITTTNTLAEICQHVGANWQDIAETLRLDKRIGSHAYLKPGLGVAGGNLERDLATVNEIAFHQGAFVKALNAQIADSKYRSDWILRTFKGLDLFDEETKLGVLGLSYKEDTHSLKNSPSINFLRSLNRKLIPRVFDPIVKNVSELKHLIHEKSASEIINKTNVLAILTPWSHFYDIDYSHFEGYIIDPYGIVKNASKAKNIYQLG